MSKVNLSDVSEPITLAGLADCLAANVRQLRWAFAEMEKEIKELRTLVK